MANTVFIVYNTAGQPIAAIQPNTLNGPGGVQQSSDLSMFGLGYSLWGQASDQNDYRLIESFACPDMSEFPTSPRYAALALAGTLHTTPASSIELNPGNGINVPIVGQCWFNTTQQIFMVFAQPSPGNFAFQPVAAAGGSVPTGPNPPLTTNGGALQQGQLWFDTAMQPPGTPWQLRIYAPGSPGAPEPVDANHSLLPPDPYTPSQGVEQNYLSVATRYVLRSNPSVIAPFNFLNNNLINGGSIQAASFTSPNGVSSNQITIPNTGNTTISDGPRIGPFVIFHTGNAASLNQFAVGMIVAWFGIPTALPVGWHICDGGTYNGHLTPNLVGQIPFGATPGLGNVGVQTLNINTGGANASVSVTVNGTTLTISEMPSHNHQTVFYTGGGSNQAGPPGTLPNGEYWFSGNGNGIAQTITSGSTGSGGSHTHTVTTTQSPHAHGVAVSVYGIYFIMYTG